jgi:hypothetical protein
MVEVLVDTVAFKLRCFTRSMPPNEFGSPQLPSGFPLY